MQTVLDDCLDCLEELDHCHEQLVVHASGTLECAHPNCEGSPDLHEWMIACADLPAGCGCDRPRYSMPLAA